MSELSPRHKPLMEVEQPVSPPGEISFTHEVARKATHMGALIIPGGYYLLELSKGQMLAIMVPIALAMFWIDIARLRRWSFYTRFGAKLISPMVRGHEDAGDFTGATYILLSTCLTIALYDKPIAIAALTFIIVGDTFAALIGRKFGRHKFGRKSVEGSLGCLAGTLIVAVFTPDLALEISIFGAFVATVTEALSVRLDDNVSVPVVSGLAMSLLYKILTAG
jgi:dolichol kinase